jgi:hypothetical protein
MDRSGSIQPSAREEQMQQLASKTHHALKKTQPGLRRGPPLAPQWPSFAGTSQFVGTSPTGQVTVFVDPALGPRGLQNARDLVEDADRVVNANNQLFGTQGGPVNVIVFALDGRTDATGGADHMGCDFTTGAAIEVCAAFGNSARVSALFEAELSECSMGGNLCGVNTGEALSRWCAAAISNDALADFATAPTWAAQGFPNFVDMTDPTDTNPVSTGNGMAFISWLISLGHSLDTIAPALVSLGAGGTLAQLFESLTGESAANAFSKFMDALNNLPNGVTSDDPFGQPAQLAQLDPVTVALAGKLFSSILSDLAASKSADHIVSNVHAIMKLGPTATRRIADKGCCNGQSRRLRPPG